MMKMKRGNNNSQANQPSLMEGKVSRFHDYDIDMQLEDASSKHERSSL
jgi:hypothetical protein